MPVQSLEYKRHVLLPAQSGRHWTVLIRSPDRAMVHSEYAEADDYQEAIWKAQRIVDGIHEKGRVLTVPDRSTSLDPLPSTRELHDQIAAGLQQREHAVERREAEARKMLEQTLASCAEERASIGRERSLLVAVEKLYRQHAHGDPREVPRTDGVPSAPVQRPPLPPTVRRAILEPDEATPLVARETEDQVAVTIRTLRQELIGEISAQKEKA